MLYFLFNQVGLYGAKTSAFYTDEQLTTITNGGAREIAITPVDSHAISYATANVPGLNTYQAIDYIAIMGLDNILKKRMPADPNYLTQEFVLTGGGGVILPGGFPSDDTDPTYDDYRLSNDIYYQDLTFLDSGGTTPEVPSALITEYEIQLNYLNANTTGKTFFLNKLFLGCKFSFGRNPVYESNQQTILDDSCYKNRIQGTLYFEDVDPDKANEFMKYYGKYQRWINFFLYDPDLDFFEKKIMYCEFLSIEHKFDTQKVQSITVEFREVL
jgi:hypothetical protein